MARRRPPDPDISLFPFMSVLAAVMGTLILIIAGMSQIAIAEPKQGVELEAFAPDKKTPIYVECTRNGLLLHADDPLQGKAVFVPRDELERPDNAWAALRTRLQLDGSRYYLLFMVRERGVKVFNMARDAVSGTGIEVGYEPVFSDGDLRFRRKKP